MQVPAISKPVLGFFRHIAHGYFRRHFHGVRVSGADSLVEQATRNSGPVIVYANHSSWWDPMVSVLLAERLAPGRSHFAPMDAAALERYGLLKHIGIFPVEMHSARGAVQFLRTGETILRAGGFLWVTPQGRFVDARVRPLVFKPGLAALASRVATACGECTVLPLAIEYPFWDERLPEVLLEFGTPVRVAAGERPEAVEGRLRAALEETMDDLRAKSFERDATLFETLAQGTLGAGGFYALGKRMVAAVTRRPYQAEHTLARALEQPGSTHVSRGTSAERSAVGAHEAKP